jgi:hypothetical protein
MDRILPSMKASRTNWSWNVPERRRRRRSVDCSVIKSVVVVLERCRIE